MKATSYITFILGSSLTLGSNESQAKTQPNVIYILADDLGYGDLGCYGQQHFSTPHIDKLAAGGMKFMQHYAGSTISGPSRSSLMTGLHTGHTFIRGNKEMRHLGGQFPMKSEAYTIAEMFKQAGYQTGAFGKWGLGYPGSEGDPNNQGFDEFFGYNCQAHAHRYYPDFLMHNQNKLFLEGNDTKNKSTYAPDLIHQKALAFIREHKNTPFFAYIPVIQPHAELLVPDDTIFSKYKNKYKERPYIAPHKGSEYGSPDFNYVNYCSQPYPRATFAAMVSRIDQYVGDIMDLLVELEIDDNTILIFSSDNGPHREGGADPDFFDSNAIYSGYKRDLTEGGIRVPMIAYWKNKINRGSVSTVISAFWDIMPTFSELIGVKLNNYTDGISLLPTLLGDASVQQQHDFLYWEFKENGGSMAVRLDNWKAIRKNVDTNSYDQFYLYNLEDDPQEKFDVSKQYPHIMKQAQVIMENEHKLNEDYPFAYEKKNK